MLVSKDNLQKHGQKVFQLLWSRWILCHISFLSCPALRYTMTINRLFSPAMVTSEPEVEIIEMILVHSRTSAWSHCSKHTLYWHINTIHILYSHIKVCESHSVVSDSLWPHGLYNPWNSPGHNTGVGSRSVLLSRLWIYPTQGSNPGLPHCRQILNQLNHKGSPTLIRSITPNPGTNFILESWRPGEWKLGLDRQWEMKYFLPYQ